MRAEPGTLRKRLLSWGLAYAPAAAFAVLLPKCPLCIAAELALLGVAIPLPSYARALVVMLSVALGTAVILVRRKSVRGTLGSHTRAAGWLRGGSCGGKCG